MSHISKPVDWEIFNIPPNQPIKYYSIVKKQSDFSRLIMQYDTQVFRHGYQHYCGIVPNYLSSSLNNTREIFILFLNELPTTSFIGFQVKVSNEAFPYESKSLLLFLKNCKKAVFYKLKNNRIHVQCGTNAWELFYLLYDNYLRRYVLNIIGTRFFYHFVYTYCIEKEKQTLKLLSKKSKPIRVSKSSIYYKIHRKRKISVTDLIHMTLNMPKRKKYTLSWFNSKESQLHSDMENGDFSTISGNKISVSKLILKKYKQGVVPEKYSKLIFTDSHQVLDSDSLSDHFKVPESSSTENQWKEYKKFASYKVQNYSTIPFMNPLICSFLKSEKSSCEMKSHSLETNSSNIMPLLLTSNRKQDESKNTTVVQEACASSDHIKNDTSENLQTIIKNFSLDKSKSFNLKDYPEFVLPHNPPSQYSTIPNNDCENILFPNNLDLTISDINSTHFLTNTEDVNKKYSTTDDVNFSTATGKMINISSAAMLKAYKLCEKEEKVPEKSISNLVKHEAPESSTNFNLKRKSVKRDASLLNIFNSYSPKTSFYQNNENMPKKLKVAQSSNTENLKLGNFDASEDVTFSTAAGKTITISNTAIEAAQKVIYKSTNDKMMPNENLIVQKNKFFENKTSDSCTSKADDVDMDNTLVEKFFEDVQFDENEFELSENNINEKKLNVNFELKNDNLPTSKRRKSLGGRRSMKYCMDKL